MSASVTVKDSVNLPKTKFKMQANLAQNEPKASTRPTNNAPTAATG